jgi:hypothetical protein
MIILGEELRDAFTAAFGIMRRGSEFTMPDRG